MQTANTSESGSIEPIVITTYKYAGQMATGFKETLIELSWKDRKNGILIATFGDVEYDNYRQGKQNNCTITANSGAAILIDSKGKTSLMGLASEFLGEAKTIEGKTFDIKSEIKAAGYSFNGNSKTWDK